MARTIKNLDAALGAEIADIDLSKPLPRADINAIEAARRERLLTSRTTKQAGLYWRRRGVPQNTHLPNPRGPRWC
jgi:hypothetical protein